MGAACGELSIVVGAAPSLYREALPVLELLGSCVRVGGVGSAQIANACEQYVIAATAMAVSEAAVIAERAASTFLECCTAGSLLAGSRVLSAAQVKLNRDFEPDLPAGTALAPLEVASQQAWRTGTTARLLGSVRELFQLLDRAGLSSQDLTATYEYLAAQHPERREAQGWGCVDAWGASECRNERPGRTKATSRSRRARCAVRSAEESLSPK